MHFRGDVFNLDKIFFPINQHNCAWSLAVAFMQEKKIQFYTPMGDGAGQKYLNILFRYIKDEHADKKNGPLPDIEQWQLVLSTRDTPQQQNSTLQILCMYLHS